MMVRKCKWFTLLTLMLIVFAQTAVGFAAPMGTLRVQPDGIESKFTLGVKKLRIATYNIHHGANSSNELDLQGILTVLNDLKADVVLLTEVDVGKARSNMVDQVRYLAEGADFPYYYYAPSLPKRGRYKPDSPKPLNLFGTAILSRFPILEARRHFLPTLFRAEPRVILDATLSLYGREVKVYGIHLSPDQKLRQQQVDSVLRSAFTSRRMPSILVGDFNARPESKEVQKIIHAGFTDAASIQGREIPTFPAWAPSVQIDYIFLDSFFSGAVSRVETKLSSASDHLPYLAEILLP